jgi:UDP-N-acetylglucosamine--N-acetylmuramyl-(pentapeptide) pyrophosphoryl-undecaprenol N-acetylglucosamine transferase
MQSVQTAPLVAIACGGSGGHLFPGLAVAEWLAQRGCAVVLMVSRKAVDQESVRAAVGMRVVTLPAVGLTPGNLFAFLWGFWDSYNLSRREFNIRRPAAVLAMGGFTGAPPVLAGRALGAVTLLHESNSIPGRANRWLARKVNHVMLGFPGAAKHLPPQHLTVTGTPVRSSFRPLDSAECRAALGLDGTRPTLLIMGGSQGARGINELVVRSLPSLSNQLPSLQFLHLTGANDLGKVRAAYFTQKLRAEVRPFLSEMELALGAATAAISRAGAASLAEIAAMRLPTILVPYPAAADNHQFHNAQALVETGAARMLAQRESTPEKLVGLARELIENGPARDSIRSALAVWHRPDAAERIAAPILAAAVNDGLQRSPCARPDQGSRKQYRLSRLSEAPPRALNSESA